MIAGKRISLNAHLLSGKAGFRSAGIHGYIYHSLAHLPVAAPETAFTVYLGHGVAPENDGLRCIRSQIDTSHALKRVLWEQTALPFKLKAEKPDLFHGMAFSLPFSWDGPSVVTIYDLSFKAHPEYLTPSRKRYLDVVTTHSVNKARRIVTISEFARQELADVYDIDTAIIDIAYPGVNPGFHVINPDEIEAFRKSRALPDRFLFYLGTLEPRKNLLMLVSAYANSAVRGDVKLVLAGGRGWMTDSLFKLIDGLNLTNDVLLPGYLSSDEIALWYNAAEVVVFPSLYEGFGMPIIEAMACGKPVIASQATSLPEAAGSAGLLLPPEESDRWSLAMEQILSDPAMRAEMAQKGLEHAARFSWENTAASIVRCYAKSLSSIG